MNVIYRATAQFMSHVRRDLTRLHKFAEERVGFISVKAAQTQNGFLLIAQEYFPVADDDYAPDHSVGAMLNQEALRKALNIALLNEVGMLHVHMHLFGGRLWFSRTDIEEQHKFVPDFFKVRRSMPHGALVLSPTAAVGRIWTAPNKVELITEINIVGARLTISRPNNDGSADFFV